VIKVYIFQLFKAFQKIVHAKAAKNKQKIAKKKYNNALLCDLGVCFAILAFALRSLREL
jgi:hypothetical protein